MVIGEDEGGKAELELRGSLEMAWTLVPLNVSLYLGVRRNYDSAVLNHRVESFQVETGALRA
jgi:hypothetical protein